ncbi:sensor histidine kinase [Thermogemmatispora carboxidivorans]|uniref:sensor histidine kinase n=1 Tax=Thermogemmatispora carboxidivorans TaxID=1382306 RepID=UPI00069A4C5E|nr:ATP-binding protein [Thermogemmatispora carboxidivorans]
MFQGPRWIDGLLRRPGRRLLVEEAGASLFRGLRTRLTLWYCGVLGAALILFGVALYFGANYFLLQPLEDSAQQQARQHVAQWLAGYLDRACASPMLDSPFPAPSKQGPVMEWVVCFNAQGHPLVFNNSPNQLPPGLISGSLVQQAIQEGDASDIVDGGSSFGAIYRYARAVPGADGSEIAGVVLVGESIQAQENALSLLLVLLLCLGALSLLGAGIGGLFLANRALAPARLAWANQQRFIADASHELRTPLTLLRADAEVLLRSRLRLQGEDAALLEDIVTETNHLAAIANNLLTLARLDSGQLHREHEVVHLAALAHNGARRIRALASQRAIRVEEEHCGQPYVIGDPLLLEQAILVLLDNALKYNRQGGSVLIRTLEREGRAVLEVCDTGIGIPPEHLPHLGERFYRVDKARSREVGGTGLGLSIARGIARLHRGQLTLTSAPGQGTVATLSLPLARSGSFETLQHRPARLGTATPGGQQSNAR